MEAIERFFPFEEDFSLIKREFNSSKIPKQS